MNNHFQGCCLLKPFALKTPSFASSKQSSISRASAIIYENQSDVVILRRPSSSWRDDDDHSIEDHLSQVTRSSLDVNAGSLKSVSDKKNMRKRKKQQDVMLETCLVSNFDDRISTWVYNCVNPDLGINDSAYKRNGYQLQKNKVQSTNKFLDLMTMCFWKCSAGCQELPEFNKND